MHKMSSNVADFVADNLQTRQKLIDTERAKRVAALKCADVGAAHGAGVQVQGAGL